MTRRLLTVLATLAAAAAILPAAGSAGGGASGAVSGYGQYPAEARALGYCTVFVHDVSRYRSCLVAQAVKLVVASKDSADELPRIDRYAQATGGWLDAHCHILMHAVGRRYAAIAHVTLENLLHYLPKTNDPNCSAGFSHGLLIDLGPQIKRLGPKGAAADCHRAPTRYQRYSCIHGLGHAYARLFVDAIDPALNACEQLGPDDAPDCAQGVYHDYWIAVSGLDAAHSPADAVTDPRELCAAQPKQFVLPCWYRALLERPPKNALENAGDILGECSGLDGVQRAGCIVGSSLITSSDPYAQLQTCAALRGADAAACVRGVQVPALLSSPLASQVSLIRGCAVFDHTSQRACYEWLGKALNVDDNGTFARRGCPRLRYAATRATCARGAASYEGPLATFS